MHRLSAIVLFIATIVTGLVSLFLVNDYITQRDQLADAAFTSAQSQSTQAAENIDAAFRELMTIAETLADDLSSGALAYTDIYDRLERETSLRPDIDGLAITFEPFVFDPDLRLYQTYFFRQADGSFDTLVGATYDYTRRSSVDTATDWYVNTIDEGAQWHEPFVATGAGKILVEYGVPFFRLDDPETPAGIVSIDYSLDDVRQLMQGLDLGATGYGAVMTDRGTFLTHPVQNFVINRTVFDLFADDDPLISTVQAALMGEATVIETSDPISGVPTWIFLQPIQGTGWTISIILNKQQFEPNQRQTAQDQMTIALAVSTSLFLALSTIFHVDRFQSTNFWAVSAVFSLISVALIIFAWVLTARIDEQTGVNITSQSELNRYIQSIDRPPDTFTGPLEIPTGVMVQALKFPDPTSITVNGYIWQRYDVDSDVQRGFSLLDQIGEEATIEEIQREVIDGEEVIVWYVGVSLRQRYDTSQFPFDRRDITIRMLPADLQADAILTPDLAAYNFTNPATRPGMDPQANINNWSLERSRFSYLVQPNLTTFGLPTTDRNGQIHELRFSIQAHRIYLGPFIAYLLPGMIAMIMTFAYLLSGRRVGDNDEIVSALNYSAALFFVVAVIHTALRDQIAAIGITYMEYVYILLYVAIIAVAGNVFVVARFPEWGVVRYRDNLMPKVLYWPVLAGVMLVVTLGIFVY